MPTVRHHLVRVRARAMERMRAVGERMRAVRERMRAVGERMRAVGDADGANRPASAPGASVGGSY